MERLLHLPAPQPTQGSASLGTPRTSRSKGALDSCTCLLPASTGRCKLSRYSTDKRSKGAWTSTCLLPASPHMHRVQRPGLVKGPAAFCCCALLGELLAHTQGAHVNRMNPFLVWAPH